MPLKTGMCCLSCYICRSSVGARFVSLEYRFLLCFSKVLLSHVSSVMGMEYNSVMDYRVSLNVNTSSWFRVVFLGEKQLYFVAGSESMCV